MKQQAGREDRRCERRTKTCGQSGMGARRRTAVGCARTILETDFAAAREGGRANREAVLPTSRYGVTDIPRRSACSSRTRRTDDSVGTREHDRYERKENY